jgi:hypothetical protein
MLSYVASKTKSMFTLYLTLLDYIYDKAPLKTKAGTLIHDNLMPTIIGKCYHT